MLLIIYLVRIIIFLSFASVCVAFIFHPIITKFMIPIVGLHALPNGLRMLTAGLQAHISRRSIYLHIV